MNRKNRWIILLNMMKYIINFHLLKKLKYTLNFYKWYIFIFICYKCFKKRFFFNKKFLKKYFDKAEYSGFLFLLIKNNILIINNYLLSSLSNKSAPFLIV